MQAVRAVGIEQWSQLCSDSFVPLRARGNDTFRGSITHLTLGEIGVSRVESTRSVVYRPGPLIAAEPRDDVLLSIHLSGTGRVGQAGRMAALRPGSAALYEADRPYQLTFESEMSELVLQVPRRRLGMRDGAIRETTARPLDAHDAGLTVLRCLLTGLLTDGSPVGQDVQTLADAAVELLAAAIRTGAAGARGWSGDALLQGARTLMQRHFRDQRLDVGAVARRLGVSRRYLEVLFAREGQTPVDYLRGLRLTAARRMLADSPVPVSEVAFAVGFADVNTFARAFRRAEGSTPGQWRRHPGPPAG